jgi:hypothetical protein
MKRMKILVKLLSFATKKTEKKETLVAKLTSKLSTKNYQKMFKKRKI